MTDPGASQPVQGAVPIGAEGGNDAAWMLRQVWQHARRWRYLLAGIFVGAIALAVVVTLLLPPRFAARTQIEVSREQKNITNLAGLESPQESRDIEFYGTQYALLKSESLAERVVRKLKLLESEKFLDDAGWIPSPASEIRMQQAIAFLLRNLDVRPVRSSRLIDVTYTSSSPDLAARIANTDRKIPTFGRQSLNDFRAVLEKREILHRFCKSVCVEEHKVAITSGPGNIEHFAAMPRCTNNAKPHAHSSLNSVSVTQVAHTVPGESPWIIAAEA